MTITPNSDRLLVRKCFVPDLDDGKGVIILPETYKETTNKCVVIAVGPDCKYFTEDDCLDWDRVEEAVYVQGGGGKIGFSQDINKAPGEHEWFLRERSLLPAAKFKVSGL